MFVRVVRHRDPPRLRLAALIVSSSNAVSARIEKGGWGRAQRAPSHPSLAFRKVTIKARLATCYIAYSTGQSRPRLRQTLTTGYA